MENNSSQVDILIKVGGSVLTNKGVEGVVNYELLDQIAKVLHQIYDLGYKIALVTGVGSIGHQTVAKFGVHYGDDGTLARRLGLLEAQIQVNELRNTFLKALKKADVPAVQFYSSSIALSRNRDLLVYNLDQIARFIPSGLVPVVSGDVVPDEVVGFSVLSGDVAFLEMFRQWRPQILIYGTDVNGICTADPSEDPNAELIEHIQIQKLEQLHADLSLSDNKVDVSGAMAGKFKTITQMIREDPTIEVHILNLKQPENLLKVIQGEQFVHTVVEY